MNEAIAILYGVIQGLTEFLPVSSSAHLALLPRLLHFRDPGVVFDLGMHMGTAFSVMVAFRSECIRLMSLVVSILRSRKWDTQKDPFLSNMLVATLVTVFLALILKGVALEFGRNPILMAILLMVFGSLMWLSDKFGKSNKAIATFNPRLSIVVGIAQALALFPGVSRSGVTMTALRGLGFSRRESAHFSFFLSLPLILGGMILESRHLLDGSVNFDLLPLLIGFFVSFLVGLLAIKVFIQMVERIGLFPFFLYRLALGIFLLGLFL